MNTADQPDATDTAYRWSYYRDSKGRVSKWVMRDPLGRIHWVTKFDNRKLCIVGYAGEHTDWKVQRPVDAREAVECMVREGGKP